MNASTVEMFQTHPHVIVNYELMQNVRCSSGAFWMANACGHFNDPEAADQLDFRYQRNTRTHANNVAFRVNMSPASCSPDLQ